MCLLFVVAVIEPSFAPRAAVLANWIRNLACSASCIAVLIVTVQYHCTWSRERYYKTGKERKIDKSTELIMRFGNMVVLAINTASALITIQAPVYFIVLIPTAVFLVISIIAFIKAALKKKTAGLLQR